MTGRKISGLSKAEDTLESLQTKKAREEYTKKGKKVECRLLVEERKGEGGKEFTYLVTDSL